MSWQKLKKLIGYATSERMAWSVGLLVLFFGHGDEGPTLCLFHWMGLTSCWGCGIGHALHDAMHLEFSASMEHHPLGIPILLILLYRVYELSRPRTKQRTTWISNS
ncbi:MAG: DUF2752 domain-containing protein [Flavobacteriales bacterium]|nr:DUF2752 domain-containing protein [Flavobacteriales bacterium]